MDWNKKCSDILTYHTLTPVRYSIYLPLIMMYMYRVILNLYITNVSVIANNFAVMSLYYLLFARDAITNIFRQCGL